MFPPPPPPFTHSSPHLFTVLFLQNVRHRGEKLFFVTISFVPSFLVQGDSASFFSGIPRARGGREIWGGWEGNRRFGSCGLGRDCRCRIFFLGLLRFFRERGVFLGLGETRLGQELCNMGAFFGYRWKAAFWGFSLGLVFLLRVGGGEGGIGVFLTRVGDILRMSRAFW